MKRIEQGIWAVVFLLCILIVTQGHCKTKKDKTLEYDLLPNCILTVKPDPSKFHCVVIDPTKPTQIMCDNASFQIVLHPGSKMENCTTVHLVTPEESLVNQSVPKP